MYKSRWIDYFHALDVDNSGFIDPSDLTHIINLVTRILHKPEDSPEVQKMISAYKTVFQGIIRDFDLNKDGKVSQEEVLLGVEKHFVGKTPETVPDWWKESARKFLESADANNNGELCLEETALFLKRVDPSLNDEDIAAGYNWILKLSPTGKFDATATSNLLFYWATSPDHPPELETVMVAFRKREL